MSIEALCIEGLIYVILSFCLDRKKQVLWCSYLIIRRGQNGVRVCTVEQELM